MSTPTPSDPEQGPSYTPPPAPPYAAPPAYQPPQYPGAQQYPGVQQYPGTQQYPAAPQHPGTPQYPGTQQYPGAPQYPAAAPQHPGSAPQHPGYPYGAYATVKTNTLAILALIGSILGFVWILPIIGSLAGAIMGHISLNQITRSGEKGRGMALAGVIVGWAGLGLFILGILVLVAVVSSTAGRVSYGA